GRDHRRRMRHTPRGIRMTHTATLVAELTVLVLAIFLGFEVISKVLTMLHTPLMSGANAIHGIVISGALIVAGAAHQDGLIRVIGFVAVALAAANVVGVFGVTDRVPVRFQTCRSPGDRFGRTASTGAIWSRASAAAQRRSSRLRSSTSSLPTRGASTATCRWRFSSPR